MSKVSEFYDNLNQKYEDGTLKAYYDSFSEEEREGIWRYRKVSKITEIFNKSNQDAKFDVAKWLLAESKNKMENGNSFLIYDKDSKFINDKALAYAFINDKDDKVVFQEYLKEIEHLNIEPTKLYKDVFAEVMKITPDVNQLIECFKESDRLKLDIIKEEDITPKRVAEAFILYPQMEAINLMIDQANKYQLNPHEIYEQVTQNVFKAFLEENDIEPQKKIEAIEGIASHVFFNNVTKKYDWLVKRAGKQDYNDFEGLFEVYKTKNKQIIEFFESKIDSKLKPQARFMVFKKAMDKKENSKELLGSFFNNLTEDEIKNVLTTKKSLSSEYNLFDRACGHSFDDDSSDLECAKLIFAKAKDYLDYEDFKKMIIDHKFEYICMDNNLQLAKWYIEEAIPAVLTDIHNEDEREKAKLDIIQTLILQNDRPIQDCLNRGSYDVFHYIYSKLKPCLQDKQLNKRFGQIVAKGLHEMGRNYNVERMDLRLLIDYINFYKDVFGTEIKVHSYWEPWVNLSKSLNERLGVNVTELLSDLRLKLPKDYDYNDNPATKFAENFVLRYQETIKLLAIAKVPLTVANMQDVLKGGNTKFFEIYKTISTIDKSFNNLPHEVKMIIAEHESIAPETYIRIIETAKEEQNLFALKSLLSKSNNQNASIDNVKTSLSNPNLSIFTSFYSPDNKEFMYSKALISDLQKINLTLDEILGLKFECKKGEDSFRGNILTKILMDDGLRQHISNFIKLLASDNQYKPILESLLVEEFTYQKTGEKSSFIQELFSLGANDIKTVLYAFKKNNMNVTYPENFLNKAVESSHLLKFLVDEGVVSLRTDIDNIFKAICDNERADAAIIDYLEQNHKSSLDLSKLHNSKSPAVKDKVADMVAKAEEAKRKAEEAERQLQEIERLAREQEETKRREEEIRRDEIERIRKQQEEIRRAGRERRQQIVDVVFHRHEPQLSPEMQRLYDESERRSQESEAIERSGELRVAQIEASLAHFEQNNNERLAQELVALRNPAANPTANPPAPPAPADPANQPHVDTVKFRGFGSKGKKLKDNPAKRDVVKHFFKEYQAVIWTVGLVLGCAFAGIAAFMGAAGLVIGGAMGAGVAVTRFVGGIKAASKAGRLNFGEVMKSIGDMVFLGHNLGIDKATEAKLKNTDITIEKAKDRKGWRAKATSKQNNGRNV